MTATMEIPSTIVTRSVLNLNLDVIGGNNEPVIAMMNIRLHGEPVGTFAHPFPNVDRFWDWFRSPTTDSPTNGLDQFGIDGGDHTSIEIMVRPLNDAIGEF